MTPQRPKAAALGFTLLEMLVVLILIGIVLGFAVASLRGPDEPARLQQEAQRIRALLQLASEQAVLQMRTYGMRVRESGYEFTVHDIDGWHTVSERPFQARALPTGIRFETSAAKPDGNDTPRIMLFADGSFTPFELQLRSDAGAAQRLLQGREDGQIESHVALQR